MNFGHVCGNSWWLVSGIAMSAVVLWIIHRKDPEFRSCETGKIRETFLVLCNIMLLIMPMEISEEPWYVQGCFLGMFVYLMVAGVMDYQLQMVSDFLHGIGLLSCVMMVFCNQAGQKNWWSLIMFCMIQYLVFRHMYGAADVAVFMICALFFTAEGRDMEAYLLHMAIAFFLLGIVQAFRGNISKQGNLKVPVALVPYIAISFFVII